MALYDQPVSALTKGIDKIAEQAMQMKPVSDPQQTAPAGVTDQVQMPDQNVMPEVTTPSAAPTSSELYQASPVDSAPSAAPAQATVAGQLDTLLKKDSPLYDIAEGDTLQRMNERGLANSSIALGEQELARSRIAMDVGKQDAATHAQSSLSTQQYGQASQLSAQEYEQQAAIANQDFLQKSSLLQQQIGGELASDLAKIDAQIEGDLAKIAENAKSQTGIDAERYSMATGGQYLDAVTTRQTDLSNEIQTIWQTEGLTLAQQNGAIAKAEARYAQDINLLGRYYSQSTLWDPEWEVDAGPGSPGAPDTAVTPPPDSWGDYVRQNDPGNPANW